VKFLKEKVVHANSMGSSVTMIMFFLMEKFSKYRSHHNKKINISILSIGTSVSGSVSRDSKPSSNLVQTKEYMSNLSNVLENVKKKTNCHVYLCCLKTKPEIPNLLIIFRIVLDNKGDRFFVLPHLHCLLNLSN
jgi:hypothetical protein